MDCLVQTGATDEAIAMARRASELSRGRAIGALAFSYAAAGKRSQARQILDDLTAKAKASYVQPLGPAAAYLALGDRERAFAWLEQGFERRAYAIVRILTDARFDSLRADTRYTELVRRMGLQS